ncbi:SusC/RagA family TonB-linked outer membrane protein [Flavobacterium sp. 1355]|uniref:SusC/RagA family TonB-linked outer membrane protein n=1 Tax=Flavobacterium sp. 1355 TaxID=2806571 RepID=UPI001AEAD2C7|nr:TonB-dependent receptor [Flavobacterium sp. 1355]MBP1225429.1 TonB-linked SusC/RagA family outer membrane protein [Flavobacterium sp. 1355]
MMLKLKFAIIALLMISYQNVMAQSKTIQGVVTDPSGIPLPGASINVVGSKNSASTDFDGKYSLRGVNPTDKITYSYVGLTTQTVVVGNRDVIDVKLAESAQTLQEVVVAYGTQKRTKVTGAISTVSAKDITAVPITNAESALQGRAAGVTVVNGSPGSNPVVSIRGLATMNNSNPLYVVDGVLVGNLSGLNPSDIESMSVLKDASTTALYGSRAFNGVIMVTTKKGRKGPGQLNFSTYAGYQTVSKRYDVLNTQQYLQYAKDLGSDLTARAAEFGNINTNWQDQIFQDGLMQDYNLSFSNGTENSTSRYSAGYLKQEGTLIGTGYERYSFRANNTQNIGRLSVGSNIGVSFSKTNPERASGGRTLLEHAIKMAPYFPVYNANNKGGYQGPTSALDGQDAENPVRVANLGYQKINGVSIIGNIFAELEIYKGLKYRSQVSLDYFTTKDHTFIPSYSDGVAHTQAFASIAETNSQGQTIVFDNSLSYKTTIAEKHNIEVLGVITKIENKFQNLVAGSRNTLTDELDQLSLVTPNLRSTNTETNNLGYIARINYDYNDKYILALSGRRDGSSRFGPNNRFGNFYSVALGWNIAKESFMNDSVFSTLKLRASIGTTGNDALDNYQYSPTLTDNYTYPINGGAAIGITPGGVPNPDLKWESKKDRNIGLDFGLFEEAFTGSIEYFNNKSSDILFRVPLAASIGAPGGTQFQNIADVKVSGFELTLGYNDRKGDFTWSATANLGTSKNEVTGLAPTVTSVLGGPSGRAGLESFSRLEVGQPLFYFWGYETNGIYQNQAEVDAVLAPGQTTFKPGDIRFVDRNGDKIISSEDKTNIGNPYPDFTYGLNLTAGYKKFDFNCFITGVAGNDIFNANKFDLEAMPRLFNASTSVLDRSIVVNGVVTNPSATLPRADGATQNYGNASQRYVEDGSFTRLKNVTIGYTFSEDSFAKYFQRLRFYVSGQNLITITDYSGLDPEVSRIDTNGNSAGVDIGRYPQPKSVIFGLEVTF